MSVEIASESLPSDPSVDTPTGNSNVSEIHDDPTPVPENDSSLNIAQQTTSQVCSNCSESVLSDHSEYESKSQNIKKRFEVLYEIIRQRESQLLRELENEINFRHSKQLEYLERIRNIESKVCLSVCE